MDSSSAIEALAALAQPTRIDAFRLLVKHEPDGMAAGTIARTLGIPQNTMSSHLSVLAWAGLVAATRVGRSIVYRANLDGIRDLMLFLVRDCCDGQSALCAPLIADLTACSVSRTNEGSR